jgi:aspartate aminotransferase
MLIGSTYKIKTPVSDHAMYVTINDIVLNEGTEHEQRRPFEVFINSKNLDHYQWIVALTRIISAVFRKGGDVAFLVEELKAVFDPRGGYLDVELRLSDRVLSIKPSPTLAVTNKAAELKAAGKDIIGLGAGEPDFDTPEHIKAAAIKAIENGFTKYTAVDGTPGLKKAIIAKFKRDQGLDYAPNQILVSCGGKQSFFNLALAFLNKGDEVIIPAPYWVSYPDMVLIADATPVCIECPQSQGYKITAAQLEQHHHPQHQAAGAELAVEPDRHGLFSKAELLALAEVLRKHPQVLIATDDMYEHIIWTAEKFENIVTVAPDLYDRTMVLNGVSKAYAMTGWRIGYAAGPAK